jgi:hypothetical protein
MVGNAHELGIPPRASLDRDAVEILRAWITKGSLEVALLRVWDEPDAWGILLVDLARHASRAFEREGICSEAAAMARIRGILDAEWDRPADLGSTEPVREQ